MSDITCEPGTEVGVVKWKNSTNVLTKLVMEALTSHSSLQQLCPHTVEEVAKLLVEEVSHNYLLLFVVLTHQVTTISSYARCHNQTVDHLILSNQQQQLVQHARLGLDVVPEIINDCLLSESERIALINVVNFNYLTLLTLISNFQNEVHQQQQLLPSEVEGVDIGCQHCKECDEVHCENLFNQCRAALRDLSLHSIPEIQTDLTLVRVMDRTPGSVLPVVYFFKREELRLQFQDVDVKNQINKYSGYPFDNSTLQSLQRYFNISEVNMDQK